MKQIYIALSVSMVQNFNGLDQTVENIETTVTHG